MRRTAILSALTSLTLSHAGLAATYRYKAITIQGATGVSVTGINDSGVLTGRYVGPSAPQSAGFVGAPGHFVTLPEVEAASGACGAPAPSGINNGGTVIGSYACQGQSAFFVWQNGKYAATFTGGASALQSFPPFIGTADHFSFNSAYGTAPLTPTFGSLSAQQHSLAGAGSFPQVASINADFEVAGEVGVLTSSFVFSTVVFVSTGGHVAFMQPPGAAASHGGFLNDAGQVAGSFTDAGQGLHGFVYTKGAYSVFDMPTHALAMSVQGIDQLGRVVGAYAADTARYGFVYGHGTVTRLGAFLRSASVQVSISRDTGRIAISAALPGGAQSFLATCVDGKGC